VFLVGITAAVNLVGSGEKEVSLEVLIGYPGPVAVATRFGLGEHATKEGDSTRKVPNFARQIGLKFGNQAQAFPLATHNDLVHMWAENAANDARSNGDKHSRVLGEHSFH
jgi:hypothetical protein